uniref:Ferredoxin n=1 Tax=uncultured bacterium contig00045 TaxID=1181531 RepID=A0A806KDI5_9BACT|nr:ferredoxin [uncultured bacterium contig00045]
MGRKFRVYCAVVRVLALVFALCACDGGARSDAVVWPSDETSGQAIVYFTADISAAGLVAVYDALGADPQGKVAVKITTGEPPNSNYLRPELIKDLVQMLDGTLVECNTAYGGKRASNAKHLQVAKDHGYTDIAEFDLQDADGEISLPVEGGEVLTENFVGANFPNYDYYVILSHFKGHAMAGYGGAIKNISIGIASRAGKSWIHSGGNKRSGYGGNQDDFLKAMAEAGKSVAQSLDGNILYINVMNRLSVDCDCNGNPAKPDMHDIGILASFDPVALDKACVDLVEAAPDGASLVKRINARNGTLAITHGAKIGLGSMEYELVDIGK